ncbi:hypothetical protein EVAR_37882_1 [Eumeta japonica]|uniref:Uncharacterized protein n=1 Tax=Eumeta variegata TaxID=151549 RepID=A0A4C1Y876_EUMVA|nr:hypothetical protein EVAR_37882_1 [Eumeta japonica]
MILCLTIGSNRNPCFDFEPGFDVRGWYLPSSATPLGTPMRTQFRPLLIFVSTFHPASDFDTATGHDVKLKEAGANARIKIK